MKNRVTVNLMLFMINILLDLSCKNSNLKFEHKVKSFLSVFVNI